MTSREMIKKIEADGWYLVGSGGNSHRKFRHPTKMGIVVVPFHGKELKKGLEQAILKQAGLK